MSARDAYPHVVIARPSLDDHLAVSSRAIMQAGLSWAMIDERWDRLRIAYDDFTCAHVAAWTERDVEAAANAPGALRSRAKTEAVVRNARAFRELGDVAAYARAYADDAALAADVRRRFARLGEVSRYYWLFRTNLPVLRFEPWIAAQPRPHPRLAEMVAAARANGTSPERP